jgi:hypothetical protein
MGIMRSLLAGPSIIAAAIHQEASRFLQAARSRYSTGQSKADRNKVPRRGSAKRARRREEATTAYFKQLRKEREIGVDPVFLHSAARQKAGPRAAWLARGAEWDRAHG